jgi:hypothetical protein
MYKEHFLHHPNQKVFTIDRQLRQNGTINAQASDREQTHTILTPQEKGESLMSFLQIQRKAQARTSKRSSKEHSVMSPAQRAPLSLHLQRQQGLQPSG